MKKETLDRILAWGKFFTLLFFGYLWGMQHNISAIQEEANIFIIENVLMNEDIASCLEARGVLSPCVTINYLGKIYERKSFCTPSGNVAYLDALKSAFPSYNGSAI